MFKQKLKFEHYKFYYEKIILKILYSILGCCPLHHLIYLTFYLNMVLIPRFEMRIPFNSENLCSFINYWYKGLNESEYHECYHQK